MANPPAPTPPAADRRRPGRAAVAVGLAGGAVIALVSWGGGTGPGGAAAYRILVASGEPVVARGGAVTLSAYAEPTGGPCPLPSGATLVWREGADGPERRRPMFTDGAGAFHATRAAVEADFHYRVEAGGAASSWHTVLVADPVELSVRTAVEVAPPPYAAVKPCRLDGLASLDGLAHATASIRFEFTRPAESAHLDWRPDGRPTEARILPVELDPGGAGGTAAVRLTENGTLRLVLVNEPGRRRLRTELPVPVRVTPDTPPRFDQVSGLVPRPVLVPPGGVLTVAVAVEDDIGVGTAEVEYLAGVGPAVRVPIPLTGAGTQRAVGRVTVDLTGKGVEGDTIRFRVRAADGRRIDDAKLGPQEVVYPPAGWAEVMLTAAAPPADQREVFGRRDALRDLFRGALEELTAAAADVGEIAAAPAEAGPAPVGHVVRLTTSREKVRAAADHLRAAAREADLAPDLRPLGAAARGVADGLLADAGEAVRRAGSDRTAVTAAAAHLRDAVARVEWLFRRNDRLARGRLDRDRLAALAADQARLAGAAAPIADRLRSQAGLDARFAALLADSDALRRASAAAATHGTRLLAAEALAVADGLRDLDAAAVDLTDRVRRSLLADLTRTHADLTGHAGRALAPAATAARVGRVTLPTGGLDRAAAALAAGQTVEALVELETVAAALDRAADEFDRLAAERRDPKAAARQVAAWQIDLRDRLTAGVPADIRPEQRAIDRSARWLDLPAGSDAAREREAAVGHMKRALSALDAGGGAAAKDAMTAAAEALTRAAEAAPDAAARVARARLDLDGLRADLEAVGTAIDSALRGADRQPPDAAVQAMLARRFAPALDGQLKLIDRLNALDAPGHAPRLARTRSAATSLARDLRDGLPLDAPASLAGLRREFDRLRTALDGGTPSDEVADDLARALADAETPAARSEVGRRLGTLQFLEAPALLAEAQEAVRVAEAAFRDGTKPDDRARRVRAAADLLAALADRATGREPARDRIGRLADNRKRAAEAARAAAGRPANPDLSNETRRQLGHESRELALTPVGPAGQVLKRRALESYVRLKDRPEPDRDPGLQSLLAEQLAGLAGAMADRPDLITRIAPAPREADPAVELASHRLAAAVRDLAAQVRATRGAVAAVPEAVAGRLRPARPNPFADVVRRQQALADAIGHWAGTRPTDPAATAGAKAVRRAAERLALAQSSEAVAAGAEASRLVWAGACDFARTQDAILAALPRSDDPPAVAAQLAARGGELATRLRGLAEQADRVGAGGSPEAADRLRAAADLVGDPALSRAEAVRLIQLAADGLTARLPPGPTPDPSEQAIGVGVRRAEAAMRTSRTQGDRASLREAAAALGRAAAAVGQRLIDD